MSAELIKGQNYGGYFKIRLNFCDNDVIKYYLVVENLANFSILETRQCLHLLILPVTLSVMIN